MRYGWWTSVMAILLSLCLLCSAAFADSYPTLRRGDESSAVRLMQAALQALGFDVKPDGVFGRNTRDILKQFQQLMGLKVDGVAGNDTLTKLYALAPNGVAKAGPIVQQPAATPTPTTRLQTPAALQQISAPETDTGYRKLQRGDEGDLVRAMQSALSKLGYKISVDGVFGSGTRMTVRHFQDDHDLETDGIAGNVTLSLLYSLASGVAVVTQPPASIVTPTPVTAQTPAPTVAQTPVTLPTPASSTDYLKLQRGDEGDLVRAMQLALTKLGYRVSVDGVYGTGTRSAVKRFQDDHDLKVDGIAGNDTLSLLYSLASGIMLQTPSPTPVLGAATIPATVLTGGGPLNLRDAGKSGSKVIATIPNGSQIMLYEKGDPWSIAAYNGLVGYVQTAYLSFPPPVTPTPSPTPSPSPTPEATAVPIALSGKLDRVMQLNETGDDVYYVQQRLNAYQYTCSLTKTYDQQTVAAVKSFQLRNGLKVDGFMGPVSFSVLASGRAIAFTNTYATLQTGHTGDEVTAMQTALKTLGYACEATGTFDDATKSAVIAFQKANALTADGIAGQKTLAALYSGEASAPGQDSGKNDGGVRVSGPSLSAVKLLHWFNEVKPALSNGSLLRIYDPGTGYGWTLKVYSRGNHCDSEPLTAADTASMNAAMGKASWTPHAVYVKLPDGRWTLATMHNVAHLSGGIADNNFNGHLCVHFLRDLEECRLHDPNYGVQHQNAIRKAWKNMTGEVVE